MIFRTFFTFIQTEEQIQNEVRTRVYNLYVDNYTKTHNEVNKRWVFEQEVSLAFNKPFCHLETYHIFVKMLIFFYDFH